MKKLLLLLVMLTCLFGNAQEEVSEEIDATATARHELKVNALYLVLGLPEVSYEYILNEESAVGISAAVSLDSELGANFLAIPYYRVYFGKKHAAGFFLEANAAVYTETETVEYYYYDSYIEEENSAFGAGLGLGVGAKFMTKSGWVGEILGGLGRNFVEKDQISTIYPRFGISLGKRF